MNLRKYYEMYASIICLSVLRLSLVFALGMFNMVMVYLLHDVVTVDSGVCRVLPLHGNTDSLTGMSGYNFSYIQV